MTRLIAAALILIGAAGLAHATPWFTQDPRTLPAGKWRVEEHLLYSRIDDALVNGDRAALPAGGEATALALHTRVRYGATDNLTVFVDIPWVDREYTPAGGPTQSHEGLGDLLFLGKFKYHDDRADGTRRAVALFVKPRNGDYRDLSPLVATGSGTTNVGLLHLWEQQAGATTWYASAGYVLTGSRGDSGVDPGDLLMGNLAAEQDFGAGWKGVLELNAQHQFEARQAGADLPNTESGTLALAPGVQYYHQPAPGRQVVLEAGVQIPTFTWGDRGALEEYTAYAGGFVIF